ncbi:uncharacterized protein LOC142324703 [Lycorma delicatula]|uniref:uncharacterized protein LOC142324703 n=1 Tax=Lycorma delicatula TaxID=130591 RepID=UPI003F512F6D
MKILAALHRRCCLWISTAYRMISRETAELLAGVMPIDLLIAHRRKCRELTVIPSSEKKRLNVANLQKLMNTWQEQWEAGEKGQCTYRLIGNVRSWYSRTHRSIDYSLTQFLAGHGGYTMISV